MKLTAHPDTAPSAPLSIAASVDRRGTCLVFGFSLSATGEVVRLPPPASGRADGLWQTTCFEAFVRGEGERYAELNFSPSGQWAAYGFDAHRQGMRELDLPAPELRVDHQLGQLVLTATATLPTEFTVSGAALALCAVVEEVEGTKSYWALAHADGPPDFHHPDCFAARLP